MGAVGMNPNVGVAPTQILDSAYPWVTFPYSLAAQLASDVFGVQGQLAGQTIASNASMQNAAMAANANVQSAGIGAQAQVDSQLIATRGMLRATQAQIRGDLVRAAAGDINAARRLNGEFQMQAQLANNANRLEVAKLAGSGNLFDYAAAQNMAYGMGNMPQVGGSFLAGPMKDITAPNVTAMGIDEILKYAPSVNEGGLGGGGNYGGGGGGFSAGSFAAPQMPNMNDLFGGFYNQIGSLSGNGIFGGTPTQAPLPNTIDNMELPGLGTPTTSGYQWNGPASGGTGPQGALYLQQQAANDPTNSAVLGLAAYNKLLSDAGLAPVDSSDTGFKNWGATQGFASGGVDRRGNYSARLVGEKGPEVEVETPFGTIIAPLTGQYQQGGLDMPSWWTPDLPAGSAVPDGSGGSFIYDPNLPAGSALPGGGFWPGLPGSGSSGGSYGGFAPTSGNYGKWIYPQGPSKYGTSTGATAKSQAKPMSLSTLMGKYNPTGLKPKFPAGFSIPGFADGGIIPPDTPWANSKNTVTPTAPEPPGTYTAPRYTSSRFPSSRLPNPFAAGAPPAPTTPTTGGEVTAPAEGGNTEIQLPNGTVINQTNNAPAPPATNPIDSLPWLQKLRAGENLGSIWQLPDLAQPSLGISSFPNPFQASSWYNAADDYTQNQYLDLLQLVGGPGFRAMAPYMIAAATPGRRLSTNPLALRF